MARGDQEEVKYSQWEDYYLHFPWQPGDFNAYLLYVLNTYERVPLYKDLNEAFFVSLFNNLTATAVIK